MPYADPASPKARASNIRRSLKYQARNPGKVRDWHLKAELKYRLKRFGITLTDYEQMLQDQGFACKICNATSLVGRGHGSWCVDHDHKTGFVRGVLCHNCNALLGFACDDPNILIRAAAYLEASMPVFKKDLTPIGKGPITKHSGKGSAVAPMPDRNTLAALQKPATNSMNNYAKASPMPQPASPAVGGLGSGDWSGNGM